MSRNFKQPFDKVNNKKRRINSTSDIFIYINVYVFSFATTDILYFNTTVLNFTSVYFFFDFFLFDLRIVEIQKKIWIYLIRLPITIVECNPSIRNGWYVLEKILLIVHLPPLIVDHTMMTLTNDHSFIHTFIRCGMYVFFKNVLLYNKISKISLSINSSIVSNYACAF